MNYTLPSFLCPPFLPLLSLLPSLPLSLPFPPPFLQVTLLNFMITMEGLQDQLLGLWWQGNVQNWRRSDILEDETAIEVLLSSIARRWPMRLAKSRWVHATYPHVLTLYLWYCSSSPLLNLLSPLHSLPSEEESTSRILSSISLSWRLFSADCMIS